MVVVKGNFSAQQTKKPARQGDVTEQMMEDLGLDNLVVISQDERGAVIACFSEYEGRPNFQIKVVYQKQGRWCHGKGLTVHPSKAKVICTHLGELASKL